MQTNTKKYRIISLIMALLMFITSTGFSLDMHYCKDELKSVSFFGKAKSCHDTSKAQTCPHHKEMQENKDCCENKTLVFKADIEKDLEVNTFVLPISQELSHFIVAYTTVFLGFNQEIKQEVITTNYFDPLIPRDIYVLLETYLL